MFDRKHLAKTKGSIPWFYWLSWDRFRYWIARTVLILVRYTGSRCMVLTLFYCRKSNWSARLCASPFLRTMPHRRYPRARGFISRFHRSTPIPVLGFRRIPHSEYKSRCSLSQAFLWTSRTARSLPLMKKPVERDASSAILPPIPCYILLDA